MKGRLCQALDAIAFSASKLSTAASNKKRRELTRHVRGLGLTLIKFILELEGSDGLSKHGEHFNRRSQLVPAFHRRLQTRPTYRGHDRARYGATP